MFRRLVEQEPDINLANSKTLLPSILHLSTGEHPASAEIMIAAIEAGADVNAANPHGLTSLSLASKDGHTELVVVLLDSGANFNHKDSEGYTPWMTAAKWGNLDTLKVLIAKGADLGLKNAINQNLLEIASVLGDGASISRQDAVIAYLTNLKIFKHATVRNSDTTNIKTLSSDSATVINEFDGEIKVQERSNFTLQDSSNRLPLNAAQ